MPKLPAPVKRVPWFVAAQAAMAARDRWTRLEPRERTELQRLLVQMRGRRKNLSTHDERELRRLVGKLDLPGLGRELLPIVRSHKATGRRR
jgi:hypothetical protein